MGNMTVADLRAQLQIAHDLAKMRVDFVVMPVTTHAELTTLAGIAADKLEAMARHAEALPKDNP